MPLTGALRFFAQVQPHAGNQAANPANQGNPAGNQAANPSTMDYDAGW